MELPDILPTVVIELSDSIDPVSEIVVVDRLISSSVTVIVEVLVESTSLISNSVVPETPPISVFCTVMVSRDSYPTLPFEQGRSSESHSYLYL
jgi:hypothetical protein